MKEYHFKKARPIWEEGKECEMNHSLRFETIIEQSGDAFICIAGCTDYQVYVNNHFVHWGPARAGKDFFRVDEIQLPYSKSKDRIVTVLINNYYCKNYDYQKQEAFLCAEIIVEGEISVATGVNGWIAYSRPERIKKVQRYTGQRGFCEVHNTKYSTESSPVILTECSNKRFLSREVPFPTFERIHGDVLETGSVKHQRSKEYFQNSVITDAGISLDGYRLDELEVCSVWEAQDLNLIKSDADVHPLPKEMEKDYLLFKFPGNQTGFIETVLSCEKDAEIYLTFDEILTNGKVDFTRLLCSNVVAYTVEAGKDYTFITAEPYTFQYINVIVKSGKIKLSEVDILKVEYPKEMIICELNSTADDTIRKIYNAAVSTFCQNTVDI